ncbi:MAG: trehalose-phosphatase, partial [Bacteroidota bacterium]
MNKSPFKAAIFDLDGVVTRTAHIHARAWKQMFDEYLEERSQREGEQHEPFSIETDYVQYVDGKPRYDGARSFLESRGIEIPEGDLDDPARKETVCGLGNRKNELFGKILDEKGPEVFPDAIEQIKHWRTDGIKTALITSSRNGGRILRATGLHELFDTTIDGNDAAELDIAGKPEPDIFLEAARRLDVRPEEAVVLEDAVSGVEAGRAGSFGLVVGVARQGGEEALSKHGADVVVSDLRELDLDSPPTSHSGPPLALKHIDEIAQRIEARRLALFLDYDGTLTPIVTRPEDADLSRSMRQLLETIAKRAFVAIVSGRDLGDVQDMVGLENLHYAGSHGFDIAGPDGMRMQQKDALEALPDLDAAEEELKDRLEEIGGARIERKHFAIAVHYREAAEKDIGRIEAAVNDVVEAHAELRKKDGKKIFELQPDVQWDKGRAVNWLLSELGLDKRSVIPMYLGDDVTDEDAFAALPQDGIGIRVGLPEEATHADYLLRDVDEAERFFEELLERLKESISQPDPHREMHPWELAYREWKPGEQPLREALCALGNGHIVTRGAFEEEAAGDPHYPGTYVAGGYNRLESEVSGRIIENEDLVNWPNWLP